MSFAACVRDVFSCPFYGVKKSSLISTLFCFCRFFFSSAIYRFLFDPVVNVVAASAVTVVIAWVRAITGGRLSLT